MSKGKKSSGEWQAKTLAEFETEKAVWKAQKLKDPDGNPKLSIRMFVKRSNGDLQITRTGITFEPDAADEIKAIAGLLKVIHKKALKNKERE